MKFIKYSLGILLCFFSLGVLALTNPADVIQNTVIKLQQDVKQNHASLAASPGKLYQIVNETIMPDVDVNQMSALVLGPLWRQATPDQRQQFVNQFSLLLTHTYANALLTVSEYDVSVNPMRNDTWKTSNQATVDGQVTPLQGGQTSYVTYYLVRSGDSWKIYDFSIEGVSFVQNYRSQFSSFKNINDLIAKIQALNEKNGSSNAG